MYMIDEIKEYRELKVEATGSGSEEEVCKGKFISAEKSNCNVKLMVIEIINKEGKENN